MTVEEDFAALARELEGLGLRNGSDFRIQGIKPPGLSGSEYVALRMVDDERFEVFDFDMGAINSKLVTDSFEQARALLVNEAVKAAAFHRRGPLAADPDPEMPWNEALGRATDPPGGDGSGRSAS